MEQKNPKRWGEAETQYREALEIMKSVKEQCRDMYLVELLISYHNLMVFLYQTSEEKEEIEEGEPVDENEEEPIEGIYFSEGYGEEEVADGEN